MIPAYIKSYCKNGRGFFIDLRTGDFYRLNETGARIMELIESGMDADTIPGVLCSEYAVDFDRAERDVMRFLSSLAQPEAQS